jgi:chromosome segregation ATPase
LLARIAVIQSSLFFALGFLAAGFLALMIAPAIWRRAVRLTRQRVEASVPMSLDEIQADRDSLRAEFATSVRRIEMDLKHTRDRLAEHAVKAERDRELLIKYEAETDDLKRIRKELEAKIAGLEGDLSEREGELADTAEKLREAENALDDRIRALDRMNSVYDETTLALANRQVELLARTNEVERLTAESASWRGEKRDVERRVREAQSETREAQDAARAEKKKAVDLERKIEQMLTNLADSEETIHRREKDILHNQDRLKASAAMEGELNAKLAKALDEKARLESQVSDLTREIAKLMEEEKEGEAGITRLTAERRRLDERLIAMTRENQKLRRDLETREPVGSERRDSVLREQIADLAAQVLAMTSALEGPESPVNKALEGGASNEEAIAGVVGLAERVRNLKAARAGLEASDGAPEGAGNTSPSAKSQKA